MKILSMVTEYNPFHYGHKYHLQESISKTKASHSIAIMSSSFVQRGEPSIVDKWTKAKMAIDNGVDLVIELPFIYSVQSAELFAFGAIKLVDSLAVVDYVSFGSETGNLQPLTKIANILLEEPEEFTQTLGKYLNQGLSFPASRSKAIYNYLINQETNPSYDYQSILKQSNNILAIEYLKSLSKLQSPVSPITIARKGSYYNDPDLNLKLSSATGIRKSILKNGLDSIKNFVPSPTFLALKEYKEEYKSFNQLKNYEEIFQYLLLTKSPSDISQYFDVNEGLENRIIRISQENKDINRLIDNIRTRRYPKTRIQRILIHILIGLTRQIITDLFTRPLPYIRVLGSNRKGYEILSKIKETSNIPIIQRFSDYKKYNTKIIDKFAYYEKKATNLYFLGIDQDPPLVNMDYKISQYNKK